MTSDLLPHNVRVERRLDADQVARVERLITEVTSVDRVRPLSEHVWLHLRGGGDPSGHHVLVFHGESLVGYAHLDTTDLVLGPSAEMAVLPTHRREGVGHRIIEELIAISADGRLRLWAHGESAQAAQLAHAMGFSRSRTLWQMRRSLFAELPACELPAGITVSTFIPGRDEEAWLDLNRRAFAHLPDQSNWQMEDLERRMQEEWFDAAGFLMAYRDDTLVGFHWTKVHGGKHQHTDSSGGHHDHDAIGEVYVIAVDPTEQGTGLGRALTIAGLGHLRDLGLSQAMLYVDASNTRAVAVYENLGFSRWDTDVLFMRQQFSHS